MALNEAVGALQDSFDPMQKADSTTTILLASCVMNLQEEYDKVLKKDRDQVIKDSLRDPEDPDKVGDMQADATKYYIDSTTQDSNVQSLQGTIDAKERTRHIFDKSIL